MTAAQTESLWSRGLRETRRALTSWFVALVWAIGVTAAGVVLGTLAALAVAVAIPAVTLVLHILRAPVLQRDELRRALQGADSGDAEALASIKALKAESVHILGRDFSLAAVLLALEDELAQGWRLGTLGDGATLRSRLGIAASPEQTDDQGLSARAVVGRLRIAGVVEIQHLQRSSNPRPLIRGLSPSDIASLSPLGVRVIRILRAAAVAPE